jgi:hypothetical protein
MEFLHSKVHAHKAIHESYMNPMSPPFTGYLQVMSTAFIKRAAILVSHAFLCAMTISARRNRISHIACHVILGTQTTNTRADLHTISDLEELLRILEAAHGVPITSEPPLPPPQPRPFSLPLPSRPPLLAKLLGETDTSASQTQKQALSQAKPQAQTQTQSRTEKTEIETETRGAKGVDEAAARQEEERNRLETLRCVYMHVLAQFVREKHCSS